MRTGWQQPEVPVQQRCPHLGLMFAAFSLHRHAIGHEWVCPCGTTFVVRSNGEGGKRLVQKGT